MLILFVLLSAYLMISSPHQVLAAETIVRFDIPAQSLGDALRLFTEQSGVKVTLPAGDVKLGQANAISGRFTSTDALRALISGSGLRFSTIEDGSVSLMSESDHSAMLEEVVVTAKEDLRVVTEGTKTYTTSAVTVAGKVPVDVKEIPNSVSVITRQQMDDQAMVTVADALKQATGVTFVSNDSTQSQFHARGYALEVMNDGVPATSAFSGYQQFDLAIYDRIEVFRGPDGLLQGSGAPSGTVNLVKKRPRDTFAAYGVATGGSWDNYRGEVDITGPLNKNKTLRGRVVLTGQDRDFYYDRAHDRKWLGYGILEYDLTPATTLSIAGIKQKDDSSPFSGPPAYTTGEWLNASRSFNPYPDWGRYIWDTQEMVGTVEHRFENKWLAKLTLSRRNQEFYFKDAYPSTGVDPVTLTADYARREYDYNYQRNAIDFYVNAPFVLFGHAQNVLIGFNYDNYQSTNVGARLTPNLTGIHVFNPEAALTNEPNITYNSGGQSETTQKGIYTQLRIKPIEPLTLIWGGRLTDYVSRSRTTPPGAATNWVDGAQAHDQFTLFGGLVYDVTQQISAYFSYADIFIPQSSQTYPTGMLEPRVGGQYEVGTKGSFLKNRLNAAVAAYLIRDKNRAYADPNHPNFYINIGESESKGIDAEITGSPLPGWEVSAGYNYLVTRYLTHPTSIDQPTSTWYPRTTFKLWNIYTVTDGLFKGVSAGAGLVTLSSFGGGTGTSAPRVQDAYVVVDASLGYKISNNLSAFLYLNNLFDESYHTRIGGLNTYNTYGEPFNFTFGIRGSL